MSVYERSLDQQSSLLNLIESIVEPLDQILLLILVEKLIDNK